MKKYILPLIFIFAISTMALAQDLNHLMSDYAKHKDADHNIVTKEMLSYAQQSKSDKDAFLEKLTSIESLDLEDCSKEVKSKFIKEFSKYKDGNGYETLLKVQDEEDKVTIITLKEEDTIKSIYIITIEEDEEDIYDIVMVKMTGSFAQSDLKGILESQDVSID